MLGGCLALSVVRISKQAHHSKVAHIAYQRGSNPPAAAKSKSWLNGTFLLFGYDS